MLSVCSHHKNHEGGLNAIPAMDRSVPDRVSQAPGKSQQSICREGSGSDLCHSAGSHDWSTCNCRACTCRCVCAAGIEQREISGHSVRITDLERSVCDAAKYRNKIGLDIFAEVLRTYLRKDGRSLGRLMEYAKKLRVEKVLKNYIEIAIE